MPFVTFQQYLPEVAERETRSVTVPPGSNLGPPPDEYSFLEMYCDERGCDCRRVFFYVVSRYRGKVEAVIAWGWEDLEFYAKWMKYGDPVDAVELKGPILNWGSPATEFAPALLEFVRDVLLQDPGYVERIKRHYKMFREKIDGAGKSRPRKRR